MKHIFFLVFSFLALASCSESAPPTTEVALQATDHIQTAWVTSTATVPLARTSTLVPTAIPSPTSTPTHTPTVTPTPTFTPTATATSTSTSVPSPTVTNTSSPVPPTPSPVPQIPNFPNTPIQDWNEGTFIHAVGQLHFWTDDFLRAAGVISNGTAGSCSGYWAYYSVWEESPAFTNVPDVWSTFYTEYRSILYDLRLTVMPFSTVCENGGGSISNETMQQILGALEALVDRTRNLAASVGA